MKYIKYTNQKEVKEELKELRCKSGVYIVAFANGENYVGQSKDLEDRMKAHLTNMNPNNKGFDTPAHKLERKYFEEYNSFEMFLYEVPVDELNYYEEFLAWKYGSFSDSRSSRSSRSVFTTNVTADFEWVTNEEWSRFARSAEGSYSGRKYDKPVDVNVEMLQMLINKANKPKKEKDYGF